MQQPDRVACIIRNARARRVASLEEIEAAGAALQHRGWRLELVDTDTPEAASDLAARLVARTHVEALIAAGGDGTLNAVINGVRAAGSSKPVGLIPGGTGNVWAREAAIPRDPQRALALLALGRRAALDLGVATIEGIPPRRFLLMCGIGLDGAVVRTVDHHPSAKRLLGRAAFVAAGAATLATAHPVDTTVTVDGVQHHQSLLMAVVSNTRLYGGVARLADAAVANDGALDLVTFEAREGLRGRLDELTLLAHALRGTLSRRPAPGITYTRTRAVTFEPTTPLPVQVDGEYLGTCAPGRPLHITIEPWAATLIVGRVEPGLIAGT